MMPFFNDIKFFWRRLPYKVNGYFLKKNLKKAEFQKDVSKMHQKKGLGAHAPLVGKNDIFCSTPLINKVKTEGLSSLCLH